MKFFLISDNMDTYTGMRMTGVEGVVVHQRQQVLENLEKAFADEQIGIILVTKKLMDMCKEEMFTYKSSYRKPLIVEIPDRHATSQISDNISNYIKEAVGIKI
ncbi:MAG: V-type ATP synthase subunit F [Oscillospiraceae bacterium]